MTDIDTDKIAHEAAEATLEKYPRSELSLLSKIMIILGTILVVSNTAISVYNSVVLHAEVQCNHALANALNVVGDQSRDINKDAVDKALRGQFKSKAEAKAYADFYDKQFDANSKKRAELTATTCHDGAKTP